MSCSVILIESLLTSLWLSINVTRESLSVPENAAELLLFVRVINKAAG